MVELIIHLGLAKCGSTLIQAILRNEAISEHLKSLNYAFIESGKDIWEDLYGRSTDTYNNLWEDEGTYDHIDDSILNKYREKIIEDTHQTQAEKVILSQEGFSTLLIFHPSFAQRFFERVLMPLKTEFNVRVILFLRRQDHYVESYYSHMVKRGYGGTVDDFLTILPLSYLSWKDHVSSCSQIATDQTVRILPFAPDVIRTVLDKSVDEAFLSLCGLNLNIAQNEQLINPSSSPDLLEVMSFINRSLPHERAVEINQHLSVSFPKIPGENFDLLPAKTKENLSQLYEKENRDLISVHLPQFPLDSLSLANISTE